MNKMLWHVLILLLFYELAQIIYQRLFVDFALYKNGLGYGFSRLE